MRQAAPVHNHRVDPGSLRHRQVPDDREGGVQRDDGGAAAQGGEQSEIRLGASGGQQADAGRTGTVRRQGPRPSQGCAPCLRIRPGAVPEAQGDPVGAATGADQEPVDQQAPVRHSASLTDQASSTERSISARLPLVTRSRLFE